MFHDLRHRLPRIGRGPRLLVAGLCLLLAISSATSAQRRPRSSSRAGPVVVAAVDLPVGHRLAARDLAVAQWPLRLRPAGTRAAPAAFVGRRLAGRIGAREAVTSTRLVGADLASGLGQSSVAAPVVLDDPQVAELVRPGDRVEVVETPRPVDLGDSTTRAEPAVATVAHGVTVLAVLPADADTDAEVVVAVDRSIAVRLVRDRSTQLFTIALDPP